MTDLDVIVIGAGPVGLAAGLLLDSYGLNAVVLESRPEPQRHPKARGVRLRASELLQIWGFDSELRPIAMPDESHRFIYCESVAGKEIARTQPAPPDSRQIASALSYRVTQDALEQLMEQHLLRSRRVELLRGRTVSSFRQDESGVEVTVDDGQTPTTLRARYVIAADGATSATRTALGIKLGSERPNAYWHSVLWRGDMSEIARDRPAIVFYTQSGDEALVGVGPAGLDGRWVTFVQLPPSTERPEPLTDEEAVRITREAIGDLSFPVELLSTATFRISADVADAYRSGRIFLAGDACHVLPPTGGFGINTGFADVHNLVWKLAAVLSGSAPDSLLESYEQERRPVALSNIAWSESNRGRLLEMRRALHQGDSKKLQELIDDQSAHVSPVGQDLAFSYADGAGERSVLTTATVGARAPHALVNGSDGAISIHSLFEGSMTALVGSAEAAQVCVEAASSAGAELSVLDVSGLDDPEGHLRERYTAAYTGVILVRPDGHIAWVFDATPDIRLVCDALDDVLNSGLSRAGASDQATAAVHR